MPGSAFIWSIILFSFCLPGTHSLHTARVSTLLLNHKWLVFQRSLKIISNAMYGSVYLSSQHTCEFQARLGYIARSSLKYFFN
jgi:hypothetical protein